MPIIEPPNDDGWEPIADLLEKNSTKFTLADDIRIKNFLNVKPWMCPTCGATVFGRSLKCYCKTRRPENFVLEPRE